ncbi:MAG: response regulator [Ruminococcus sp.]|nr:response regulator [Ruminococcus sp.]
MKKVLVCEDESAIRDFVVINLQRAGYDVVEADSGEAALKRYDENGGDFDVAILDVMLPGIDGFQVCKELRNKNGGLGIIMLLQANVPLYAKKLHLTEEEAGRKVRREIFGFIAYGILAENVPEGHPALPLRNSIKGPGGIKRRPNSVKIAVAHNADDQAETVLMRMLRGTGTRGLAGIRYQSPMDDALDRLIASFSRNIPESSKDPKEDPAAAQKRSTELAKRLEEIKTLDISMIRPLLDVCREDIESFCTENQLQPRIDHTNAETDYTRNKIRLELLPMLEKEYNPNIRQTLVRLAANAAEDEDALSALSRSALFEAEKILTPAFAADASDQQKSKAPSGTLLESISLDAAVLRGLKPAVFKRLIVNEFNKLGLTEGISAVHLNALYTAVLKNIGGKTIEFPGGHPATLRAGSLTLK